MDILDIFLNKYSYKFPKGYPDMNNEHDVLLMESLLSELGVNELDFKNTSPDTQYDEIIKIAEHIELTPKSVEIHGITREIIEKRGIAIGQALNAFKSALHTSDCSIGHNLSFDKRLLIVESIRNKGFDANDDSIVQLHFGKEFCTMQNSVDVCKLQMLRKNGSVYYKYPTLLELHQHLFQFKPYNAHDSKVDVIICLRCYCKLAFECDLSRESRHFRRMFRECCTTVSC